jgi:mono/diheme cytochrome c family protein
MSRVLEPSAQHLSKGAAFIVAVTAIGLGLATAAFAQSEDKVKAGVTAWRNSGCSDCHGAFANGEKERDESPTGANIRQSRLKADELTLVIRCGRPGGMPAFEEGATGVLEVAAKLTPHPPSSVARKSTTWSPTCKPASSAREKLPSRSACSTTPISRTGATTTTRRCECKCRHSRRR